MYNKKYVQTKETISVINKSFCLKKLNRNFLLDISTNIGSDEIKAKAGNQKPKFIQNSITFQRANVN